MPTYEDDVRIETVVTIAGEARCGRCEINGAVAGAELAYADNVTSGLETRGNVIVRGYADQLVERIGRLRMQPSRRDVVHTLRFVAVDESVFRFGGHSVVETDVGLWVDGPGAELVAVGTSVGQAWNRTGRHDAWSESDELMATPVQPGTYEPAPFSLGDPVDYLQWRGRRYHAEVCNLTRNVRIEGTPSGRSHLMLNHVTRRSLVSDVALRYMGLPDSGNRGNGRYALHIHHGRAPGCAIERVVVRDGAGRGIVVHGTHGPTQVREALCWDVRMPFWWDAEQFPWQYPKDASFGVVYDRCGAVLYHGARGAFELMQGEGNICTECFAACGTHVLGGGFHWPATVNQRPNVWTFDSCVTHNTQGRGLWSWQNDQNEHIVRNFTAFNCDREGIKDGAYGNRYRYLSNTLFNCSKGGFAHVGALSQNAASRTQEGILLTGAWKEISDNELDGGDGAALSVNESAGASERFILCKRNHLSGAVPLLIHEGHADGSLTGPRFFFYLHTTVGDAVRDLEPADVTVSLMHPDSVHRFERRDGSCFQMHPDGAVTELAAGAVSAAIEQA